MEFKKLDNYSINEKDIVCVKEMGNVVEITYLQHKNNGQTIKKLNDNEYMVVATGEIKQAQHIESRADNKLQVSQSLKRLRDYINTNVVDANKCKWVTLTYKENMTDTKRLYKDFEKFIKRFRYKYGNIEYIVACEPQGRGAWHMHCIIIFDDIAPFIPNNEIAKLWRQGFTKTTKLDNIDNIGAYLTAYLGDMEFDEFIESDVNFKSITFKNVYQIFKSITFKDVYQIDNIKLDKPKKFVKGGRLYMYPPKFNLYRVSRGIKKPIKQYMSYKKAKEKVGSAKPTYTSTISLTDIDNKFSNIISYESYNIKRNNCQYLSGIKTGRLKALSL